MVELLVSVSIIAVVVTILLPAVKSVRDQARSLECCSNMRSVSMSLRFFAEGSAKSGRGDSESLGGKRFWIDDFQERLYGLAEFWDADGDQAELSARRCAMLCPAAGATLTKRRGFPCGIDALSPPADVSVALNMRLRRATVTFMGKPVLAPVASSHVESRVLDHPSVPIALDVDGAEAVSRNLEPFYTAPPVGKPDPYATGQYWMPSRRHGGRTWVAFVGGHVLSSEQPRREPWDWAYQARVGH